MDEDTQCQAIDLLSRISCSADNTLNLKRGDPDKPTRFRCSFCHGPDDNNTRPRCLDQAAKDLSTAVFLDILGLKSFQESRRPRVFAMMGLKRIAKHSPDPEFLDFEKPLPGQWCLDSLRSSLRELRIAAGRTFAVYFAEQRPSLGDRGCNIQYKRKNALEFLKTLSDKDIPHVHEACILAWGQVGRVVVDDELGIVLLGLIEGLGHRNTVVSAWAFSEILNLAEARGLTPKRLFQPFWSSLAFTVVKDLVPKPQTATKVAEVLQLAGGVTELLRLLQRHALPWLVLRKKREVIQKIAEARGEVDIWRPCVAGSNLPSILAHLLVQDESQNGEFSMSLLRDVSPHFNGRQLVELLRAGPLLVAVELFRIAADGDDARKSRVRRALFR